MVQLLSEFIAALPEKVSTIRRLMDEQNIQELCEAVHQLKGTGSSYGFSTLTAVASAAEALLCAGQPIDAAQQQIDALLELIRRIRGYESAKEAPVHSPSPGTPGEGQG
jgi:HPt (histidine-containing phosphotransfer) domain-containing protein